MTRERSAYFRLSAPVVALALLAAACGGDDADDPAASDDVATSDAADGTATDGTAADGTAAPDGSTDGTEAPATDSEPIRVGLQVGPPTLDLTSSPAAAIPQVLLYNVYETLVQLAPDGSIVPLLAESYEISDDGLTYTFNLRDGVTFHGGQSFTADDVVYSIENVLTKEPAHPFATTFAPIDTVTAVDDLTAEISLTQPSANLLFFLTQGQGVMLDAEGAGDLATSANGTGPFTFADMTTDVNVNLAANPEYWGEPAAAPSVEYRIINDANALTNAMLAGDLEIVPNISAPELLAEFESDDAFTVQTGETYGEITMALNGANAPLDDVRVRQAISHAIDRQAIVDTAYSGYGTVIGTFSTPLDPYFKANADVYPYDPEKARALLDEAGVSDLTLTMKPFPTSYATRAAEFIQSQLAEVGITVEITTFEAPAGWLDTVFNAKDYDMSIVAHVEPNDLAQYGNPDYYWGNDSPAVAEMIARADAEPDEAARNAIYQEVLDTITAEAADNWLFVLPSLAVTRAGVDGYEVSALSAPMAGVTYNP